MGLSDFEALLSDFRKIEAQREGEPLDTAILEALARHDATAALYQPSEYEPIGYPAEERPGAEVSSVDFEEI